VSKSYGLKQGAIAGTYVSTRNTRMVAPVVSRHYTHTYVCMGREIPVTLREYEYLKIRELRGKVSYVWRDKVGKLEVQ
jgi:hypothetical protein